MPNTSPISGALQAAGLSAGAAGAIALPITLGLGLLAAHDKRVQIAKTESAALAQAISAFDNDIQAVAAGYSNGTLDPNQTLQALDEIDQNFQSFMKPYEQAFADCLPIQPGNYVDKSLPNNLNYCWQGGPCNKTCTSGCCVYCNVVRPTVYRAAEIVSQGAGGTFHVCQIYNSGFGYPGRPGYPITFSKPPIATTVEGQLNNIVSALTGGAVSNSNTVQAAATQVPSNTLVYIGLALAALTLLFTAQAARR